MEKQVELIKGSSHIDHRGTLTFFNEFNIDPIKRFYVIEHHDTNMVRAWQGHKLERKWFYVMRGAFKVILVRPDDWGNPSTDLPYEEFVLQADKNEILNIPSGFASGFQAMVAEAKLMIFTDFSVQESIADDFRYDKNLWYKW